MNPCTTGFSVGVDSEFKSKACPKYPNNEFKSKACSEHTENEFKLEKRSWTPITTANPTETPTKKTPNTTEAKLFRLKDLSLENTFFAIPFSTFSKIFIKTPPVMKPETNKLKKFHEVAWK